MISRNAPRALPWLLWARNAAAAAREADRQNYTGKMVATTSSARRLKKQADRTIHAKKYGGRMRWSRNRRHGGRPSSSAHAALHWKTKEGLVRGCACRGTAGPRTCRVWRAGEDLSGGRGEQLGCSTALVGGHCSLASKATTASCSARWGGRAGRRARAAGGCSGFRMSCSSGLSCRSGRGGVSVRGRLSMERRLGASEETFS